jgi:hypothetical protein
MPRTKRGPNWSEDEWVILRELYDILGPCPPGGPKNPLIMKMAQVLARSSATIAMRLLNFGACDKAAQLKYRRRDGKPRVFLTAKRKGKDDEESRKLNPFYYDMKTRYKAVFGVKLRRAKKMFGIDFI